MGLVHQRHGGPPGPLFVAPIGELRGDGERDGRPILVAQELEGASGPFDGLGE
ncbi:hypothetical protein ACFFX0_19790 [Citricoccus parietis]|uniref:Uncharacterized protein n=1 Tax=Citricoccus parietis TaxID=592307 RepID=A0ABV5G306_9MICC